MIICHIIRVSVWRRAEDCLFYVLFMWQNNVGVLLQYAIKYYSICIWG